MSRSYIIALFVILASAGLQFFVWQNTQVSKNIGETTDHVTSESSSANPELDSEVSKISPRNKAVFKDVLTKYCQDRTPDPVESGLGDIEYVIFEDVQRAISKAAESGNSAQAGLVLHKLFSALQEPTETKLFYQILAEVQGNSDQRAFFRQEWKSDMDRLYLTFLPYFSSGLVFPLSGESLLPEYTVTTNATATEPTVLDGILLDVFYVYLISPDRVYSAVEDRKLSDELMLAYLTVMRDHLQQAYDVKFEIESQHEGRRLSYGGMTTADLVQEIGHAHVVKGTILQSLAFRAWDEARDPQAYIDLYRCAAEKYYDTDSMYRMALLYFSYPETVATWFPGAKVPEEVTQNDREAYFWIMSALIIDQFETSGRLVTEYGLDGDDVLMVLDTLHNESDMTRTEFLAEEYRALAFVQEKYPEATMSFRSYDRYSIEGRRSLLEMFDE